MIKKCTVILLLIAIVFGKNFLNRGEWRKIELGANGVNEVILDLYPSPLRLEDGNSLQIQVQGLTIDNFAFQLQKSNYGEWVTSSTPMIYNEQLSVQEILKQDISDQFTENCQSKGAFCSLRLIVSLTEEPLDKSAFIAIQYYLKEKKVLTSSNRVSQVSSQIFASTGSYEQKLFSTFQTGRLVTNHIEQINFVVQKELKSQVDRNDLFLVISRQDKTNTNILAKSWNVSSPCYPTNLTCDFQWPSLLNQEAIIIEDNSKPAPNYFIHRVGPCLNNDTCRYALSLFLNKVDNSTDDYEFVMDIPDESQGFIKSFDYTQTQSNISFQPDFLTNQIFGYFKIDFSSIQSNKFGQFSLTFDEVELRGLKQLNFIMIQYQGGSFQQVGTFKEDELAIFGTQKDQYYVVYVANTSVVLGADNKTFHEKVTAQFSSRSLDLVSLAGSRNTEKKINFNSQEHAVDFMALDINQEGAKNISLKLNVDQATLPFLKVVYSICQSDSSCAFPKTDDPNAKIIEFNKDFPIDESQLQGCTKAYCALLITARYDFKASNQTTASFGITPSYSASSPDSSSDGLGLGALIGIIVAGVFILAIGLFFGIKWYRTRKINKIDEESASKTDPFMKLDSNISFDKENETHHKKGKNINKNEEEEYGQE